jgi:hypothetical protein
VYKTVWPTLNLCARSNVERTAICDGTVTVMAAIAPPFFGSALPGVRRETAALRTRAPAGSLTARPFTERLFMEQHYIYDPPLKQKI